MSVKANTRTASPNWKFYLLIIVVVSIVIIAITSVRWFMGTVHAVATPVQIAPPPTPIVVERAPSPNMDVIARQVEMTCLGNGMVDYSIFDLLISGGVKPYEFRLENMLYQVLGPFPIQKDGEPIRLKVYGGESVLVKIWSLGSTNPDWTGMISVPLRDVYCAGTPTPVPFSTSTATSTFTPTSTAASTISVMDTPSKPPKKSTSVPAIATTTSVSNPSATSAIHPSSTPVPDPTQPPVSASSTPVVVPSKPPVVVPSDTAEPTVLPPATPINPNPKECEDGKDNDGDGLTDYPKDPDCGRPGDPHEDH